jgi:hypothetical protein
MHRNIRRITQAVSSFPIYDTVVRYTFREVGDPDILSWLSDRSCPRPPRVLAVDLAHEEVLIGVMLPEGPAVRAMIDGRMVSVPE